MVDGNKRYDSAENTTAIFSEEDGGELIVNTITPLSLEDDTSSDEDELNHKKTNNENLESNTWWHNAHGSEETTTTPMTTTCGMGMLMIKPCIKSYCCSSSSSYCDASAARQSARRVRFEDDFTDVVVTKPVVVCPKPHHH